MSRTRTEDRLPPGARIGDYLIEAMIGDEETGVAYLGRHVVLPRLAVVKVMHASGAWIRQIAVQMIKEACLLEALVHPGIPRVYECGVLPDRRAWSATEQVEGVTIATLISGGAMAVADVVVLIRDVADILDHVHRRGLVHRQLSAEAVVRTGRHGCPVTVTRWTKARAIDATDEHDERAPDPRDDVYELGAIAFRALTGARADSIGPALDRHAEATVERYPGAPRDVAQLIDSMVARDPRARPSSAEVRDRARWLADTLELLPAVEASRWTPPHGVEEPLVEDAASGFAVRIAGRSRTR